MFAWIQPKESVSAAEMHTGLQMLLYDGICFQIMTVLTSGAFIIAFALLLHASNIVIGIIAAAGPLAQVLQIPAIFVVEWTGLRKAAVVLSSGVGRLFWFVVLAAPWFLPTSYHVPVVLISVLLYFGLGAISNLAFNSWMRDLIPQQIRGSYFGKRLAIATALGAVLSLLAGIGVDYFKARFSEIGIYSILFLVGTCIGLSGVYFLARIPEPRMTRGSKQNLRTMLTEPFRDKDFYQLLLFLGVWNFAVNLAAPFFTVYMLKRLGLSITLVLGLAVLSQIVNAMFFQLWGRLADRFSNKSVLILAGPLFILSILLFPFTTMPEAYVLTIPLLVLIHALAGMSTAGIILCTGNIALKLAPHGKATSYLASTALVSGIAATIAPILGGLAADWLARKELSVTLRWTSETVRQSVELSAMNLRGLDFLFMFAFVIGMYSLHRLILIKEEGEVEEGIVLSEFYNMIGKAFRSVSNVPAMRYLFYFPYGRLMELLEDDLIQDESGTSASPGLFHVPSIKKQLGLSHEDYKRGKD